jgi:hypothetical protein
MRRIVCFTITFMFLAAVVAIGCYYRNNESTKSVEATLI